VAKRTPSRKALKILDLTDVGENLLIKQQHAQTLISAKQPIDNKLQGSVAKYLRCGGVVNNQIEKGLGLLLSLSGFFFKSVNNFGKSYKQERGCLMRFLRLLAVCWPGAQSA